MPYMSPGDAFASTFEDSLLQREQLRRQQMADALAVQREQRIAQMQALELQQAKEALAEKRRTFDEAQKDKRKAAFEKTIGEMMPGDIPTPELLNESKALGLTHVFPNFGVSTEPQMPEAPVGIANPEAPPLPAQAPNTVTPPLQGGFRFIGTAKQRQQKELEGKVNGLVNKITTLEPGSPEFLKTIAEYEMVSGKQFPASALKAPTTETTPIVRSNTQRRTVERLVNGQWVPVTGDVPKGAHFLQEQDTSVRDAANADRDSKRVETSREHGYTEFNNLSKDLEGTVKEYEKVGAMLAQHTAQADADLAPLILKATVGGMGSGFRMTRAEIENTLHGRTKWEDLQAALKKWSLDPQTAQIPDSQREAVRDLAIAIRAKAAKALTKIQKARTSFDDAANKSDLNQMGRIRTQLHSDLFPEESEELNNSPKRIVYDMQGNPVKQ